MRNCKNRKRFTRTLRKKRRVSLELQRGTVHVSLRNPKGVRGKKRKSDSICKYKQAITSDSSEKLVNIHIPLTLKKQLIDDCEFITHLGKLVELPRTPNVEDILKMYLDYRYKKDNKVSDSVREIFKGICAYFNKALPVILLYKSESIINILLLRMPVRPQFMGLNIYCVSLETLLELQQKLVDFLKFVQKNQNALFLSTNHVAEDVETSTNKHDN